MVGGFGKLLMDGRTMESVVRVAEPPAIEPTEHPYVARAAGVCGGRPTIKGTRLSVRYIAELYKAGDLVEEILQAHSHLTAAAVHDAIRYSLDHQAEIEAEIAQDRIEAVTARYGAQIDERGVGRFSPSTADDR